MKLIKICCAPWTARASASLAGKMRRKSQSNPRWGHAVPNAAITSPCRRIAVKLVQQISDLNKSKGKALSYKMVAESDNETVRIERASVLVAVAKARVWASEGWHVKIIDGDGKIFASADFESLLAAA
jgi:hypothetical protein